MRLIALFFLLIGAGLAGGTVYYVSIYVKTWEAAVATTKAAEGPKTVRLVAAKVPLKYGDRLDYETAKQVLRFIDWPEKGVPPGSFTTSEDLLGAEKDEVRYVLRKIEPGELILQSKVTGFGESLRMASQVSEGMRAVTIPINAVTGGGGHISPGDRVDIEWTRSTTDGNISSVVLLRNVLVIATDQSKDAERSKAYLARTVTVEVNPTDAQKLRLAQQAGTLALLLRGVNEIDESADVALQPIDLTDLPGVDKPEVAPEPEPEAVDNTYRVKVRKGARVRDVEFDKDGEIPSDASDEPSVADKPDESTSTQ